MNPVYKSQRQTKVKLELEDIDGCCAGHSLDFGLLVPPKSENPLDPLIRVSFSEYSGNNTEDNPGTLPTDYRVGHRKLQSSELLAPGPHGAAPKHLDLLGLIGDFSAQKYIIGSDFLPALYHYSAKVPYRPEVSNLTARILNHQPEIAEQRFGIESIIWAVFNAEPSAELEDAREYLVGRGLHLSGLYESFHFLKLLPPETRTFETLLANYQLFIELPNYQFSSHKLGAAIMAARDAGSGINQAQIAKEYRYEFGVVPLHNGVVDKLSWLKSKTEIGPITLVHQPAAPFVACLYYSSGAFGSEPQDVVSFFASDKRTLFINHWQTPTQVSEGNAKNWQASGLYGLNQDSVRFSVLEYLAREMGFNRLGVLSTFNRNRAARNDPHKDKLRNDEKNALIAGFTYSSHDGNLYKELV